MRRPYIMIVDHVTYLLDGYIAAHGTPDYGPPAIGPVSLTLLDGHLVAEHVRHVERRGDSWQDGQSCELLFKKEHWIQTEKQTVVTGTIVRGYTED